MRVIIGKELANAEQFFMGALNFSAVGHRGFRAIKNDDQIITAAGGVQQVTWDVEDFDNVDVFNLATESWDPAADNTGAPHARKHHGEYRGIWQFNAHIRYNALPANISAFIQGFKNGALISEGDLNTPPTAANLGLGWSDILLLEEDDTVDVRTDHGSGADQTIEGTDAGAAHFSGWELSP